VVVRLCATAPSLSCVTVVVSHWMVTNSTKLHVGIIFPGGRRFLDVIGISATDESNSGETGDCDNAGIDHTFHFVVTSEQL
jgi:hypothetical protein